LSRTPPRAEITPSDASRRRACARPASRAALLLALCLFQPAAAQVLNTAGEGLPFGHFTLFPSVAFELTHDSNIFYRSEDLPGLGVIGSGVLVVRPRLLVDMPLGESRIRWAYTPLYRGYTSDQINTPQHLSHYFDLEGTYKSPGALTISVKDHLVRESIQLQEVDRGGELTFGLTPYTTHAPEADFTMGLGARQGVSIRPGYTAVRFSDPGEASFFDYTTKRLEGRYNHKLGPATTLYGFYKFESTDQRREQIFFGQVDLTSRTTGIGLQRTLSQAIVTTFSAGYESIRFNGGAGIDYSGPVLDLDATWQLNDITKIYTAVRRQPFQSFFVNNNYYLDKEASIRLTQQLGHRTYYDLGLTYLENVYSSPLDISVTSETPGNLDVNPQNGLIDAFEAYLPSQGVRRRDGLFRMEVGAGFQFLRTLRAYVGYNFERRQSNIDQQISTGELVDPFNYRINRIVFRVQAGWL
jgi:hypothetical protein